MNNVKELIFLVERALNSCKTYRYDINQFESDENKDFDEKLVQEALNKIEKFKLEM